jgi:hypothetical protein
MISVRGADVSAWTQTGGDRQLNPLSACCTALHIAYEVVESVRSAGANSKLPKTRPDTDNAPNSVRAALQGGGADTAPSDGGQGSV